ncbi:MAG: hypothetical protein AB8E15_12450 [Bdellovibrionales bacterium]
MRIVILMLFFASTLIAQVNVKDLSSPTRVGNGDNGLDLEDYTPIKNGKIFNTRIQAVKLLDRLDTNMIRGLGTLRSEVAKTDLYLTKSNLTDKRLAELGAFEASSNGYIYARTFPKEHAATRFFPISLSLSDRQLVALHIHEGLHRSLPKSLREDEKLVSEITMSIMAPNTSHDLVKGEIAKVLPNPKLILAKDPTTYYILDDQMERSEFNYVNTSFNTEEGNSPSMIHTISSKLYPFGGTYSGNGIGFKISVFNMDEENTVLGPLSISYDTQIKTITKFHVRAFVEHSFSADDNESWNNSEFARDITKLGMKMYSFERESISLTNSLEVTLPSTAREEVGSMPIDYQYGAIYSARMELKTKYKRLGFGSFLQYSLAEERVATSNSSRISEERARVLLFGPELSFIGDIFTLKVFSNYIVGGGDQSLERFGDVVEYGFGRNNLGVNLSLAW